jgi:ATP-dependent RNA helicase RhlE
MLFSDLKLIDPLLRAVQAEGYAEPTPIQAQTIPLLLAGRDVLGCAQTGTGKTAAFALPILQRLYGSKDQRRAQLPRVLVLTPTRELAAQIGDSFAAYGRYLPTKYAVIFGGVGQQPQVDAFRRGVDIVVATPGRLLDLLSQKLIRLDAVEMFVLDEADRMLDMGFINDVRKVIAVLPKQRQNLLYSATMPPEIIDLARSFLRDPAHVEVTPTATTVEKIDQYVYFVEKNDKRALLEHLLHDRAIKRALVFTRTKHGANKVAKQLTDARVSAEAIHGNKSQSAREKALANFKSGATRILVATDIAARGIDVDGVTHVINYDLPNIPESYVHRIGRTARAGADGIAFSFCDQEERAYLRDIERAIRKHVQVAGDHPYPSPLGIPKATDLSERPTTNAVQANAPRANSAQTNGAKRSRRPQNSAKKNDAGQNGGQPNRARQQDAVPASPRLSNSGEPRAAARPQASQARSQRPATHGQRPASSGQPSKNVRPSGEHPSFERATGDTQRMQHHRNDRDQRGSMRDFAQRSASGGASRWNDTSEWEEERR